jgi:hypothetical protein
MVTASLYIHYGASAARKLDDIERNTDGSEY